MLLIALKHVDVANLEGGDRQARIAHAINSVETKHRHTPYKTVRARIAHAINSVETIACEQFRSPRIARIAHAINSVETDTSRVPRCVAWRVLRMLLIALKPFWRTAVPTDRAYCACY